MMETCPFCGAPAVLETVPTCPTTWGNPKSEHGEHHFILTNVQFYRCSVPCTTPPEEWLDHELSTAYDQQLNEHIKAKLGIDWLALNAARRRWSKQEIEQAAREVVRAYRDGPGDEIDIDRVFNAIGRLAPLVGERWPFKPVKLGRTR